MFGATNSRQSWCLIHKSAGGCRDFKYLALQSKQELMLPVIKHNVKAGGGRYCEANGGG